MFHLAFIYYFHLTRTVVIPNRNTVAFERAFRNSEQLRVLTLIYLGGQEINLVFAPHILG